MMSGEWRVLRDERMINSFLATLQIEAGIARGLVRSRHVNRAPHSIFIGTELLCIKETGERRGESEAMFNVGFWIMDFGLIRNQELVTQNRLTLHSPLFTFPFR